MSTTMTPTRGRISIPRILLCGILLTILMAGCLYLHHTALSFYQARLLDNASKTMAWLTKQLSFALPFIVICLFHAFVYHRHDTHDGSARREMFWEVLVVAVLTYAVLIPYLAKISEALYINALAAGETIPKTEGKVEITLLMEFHEWFIRLTIPLGLLLTFHGTRARRETFCPEAEETPAPTITIVEYEVRKAAQRAAQAYAEAVADESSAEPAAGGDASPETSPSKEENYYES